MKSIGLKLWAGMMALIIFVLALLWFFQIAFLQKFYISMRVTDIKKSSASIAKLIEQDNLSEFENRADAFAFDNNLSIDLLDLKGNIIYTTGSMGQMPMMKNKERIEAFQEVLDGKEVTATLTHPRFGNKFMLIGIPIKISGKLTDILFISMPLAPVEDTALILKKQLVFITLILLVASIIISYIISKTLTKPILDIITVSQKIASGDFSSRINSKNKDEIGKLANTIDYMGEELSKIDKLKKDLIANVSHELRAPLSLIRGYAETIRDITGNVAEKREKHLNIIIEESERLSKIVDDILNLSQIQAGYINLNMKQFMINKTIDEVIKKYNILSEKTDIKIIEESSGEIAVTADEQKIEQVLYNLINNAFNHTPDGGRITIRVIDDKDNVKVEVSDTGDGISAEDIKHIWDRYYKADNTSKRRMVGTGLGLAIVKSILEAHNALYGVKSEKGAGTTFWFALKK